MLKFSKAVRNSVGGEQRLNGVIINESDISFMCDCEEGKIKIKMRDGSSFVVNKSEMVGNKLLVD